MTQALQQAEKLLFGMTRAEKAQLLQWAANDLSETFPGVESTPGICGGEPCIVGTRIPVWALEFVLSKMRLLWKPLVAC